MVTARGTSPPSPLRGERRGLPPIPPLPTRPARPGRRAGDKRAVVGKWSDAWWRAHGVEPPRSLSFTPQQRAIYEKARAEERLVAPPPPPPPPPVEPPAFGDLGAQARLAENIRLASRASGIPEAELRAGRQIAPVGEFAKKAFETAFLPVEVAGSQVLGLASLPAYGIAKLAGDPYGMERARQGMAMLGRRPPLGREALALEPWREYLGPYREQPYGARMVAELPAMFPRTFVKAGAELTRPLIKAPARLGEAGGAFAEKMIAGQPRIVPEPRVMGRIPKRGPPFAGDWTKTIPGIDAEIARRTKAVSVAQRAGLDVTSANEELNAIREYRQNIFEGLVGADRLEEWRALQDATRAAQAGAGFKSDVIRPKWAVGLTDDELINIARQEGRNPYLVDWGDAIDPVVVREAKEGRHYRSSAQVKTKTQLKREAEAAESALAEFEEGIVRESEVPKQVGVGQVGMGIGEKPAQGGLFENLPSGPAATVPLIDKERLIAQAEQRAQLAKGQRFLPAPEVAAPRAEAAPAAPARAARPGRVEAGAAPPPEAVAPRAALPAPAAEAARPRPVRGGPPPPTKPPTAVEPSAMPPDRADEVLKQFATFIRSPESINLSELTLQMRSRQLGERLASLQKRTDELLSKGMKFEEAMQQATRDAMSGAFERPGALISETMATEFRDAAFARVYNVLKDEPLERISTAEALTNALLGKAIPRIPGTAGKSAYTRLSRVFPPEIMEALVKGKPFTETLEALLLKRPPKEMRAWPYPVPQLQGETLGMGLTPPQMQARARFGKLTPAEELAATQGRISLMGEPRQATMPVHEPAIDAIIKQPSMMPIGDQNILVDVLKKAGWTMLDIGNALRSGKAGYDLSWWRQNAALILNNKRDFLAGNASVFRILQEVKRGGPRTFAKEALERIKAHKYYPLYEKLGKDFLRPLEQKGLPYWQREENFLVLGSDRAIPKFVEKIPGVRLSQELFVTPLNEMNWRMFVRYVDNLYALNERIASGLAKAPKGGLSIEKSAENFAAMLADMTGRASLGPAKALSPAMNAGFFSMRLNLGRLLTPRHLFSADPLVRKEAWKNIITFVGGIGGVALLGKELGLWDVGLNPKSADFGKIRIGPYRYDLWGGYQQYVVFMFRLATGKMVSSISGKERPIDINELTGEFARGKSAPFVSLFLEFKTGKTFLGEDVDLGNLGQWINRIAPFTLGSMYEGFEEMGVEGPGWMLPGVTGIGTAAYPYIIGEMREKWGKEIKLYEDIPGEKELRIMKEEIQAKALDSADAQAKLRALAKKYPLTHEQYRAKNPEVDAKLFILGEVDSWKTDKALRAIVRLMQENNLTTEDISGLKPEKGETETKKKRRQIIEKKLGQPSPARQPGRAAPSPIPRMPVSPTLTPGIPVAPKLTEEEKWHRQYQESQRQLRELQPVGAGR